MAHAWFRFYNSAVEDPKVQRLPAPLFRFWVNILCLASKHDGKLPTLEDIEFTLRLGTKQLSDFIHRLKIAGLLDGDETLEPHNWNGRQYISDVSTDRVKRFRKRLRNVSVTPPDTDSDTEQIQIQKVVAAKAAPKQGTRWESDRVVPRDWIEAGHNSRSKHLHPPADLETEAEKFANYWASKSGKDGTKLDWKKTWINWSLTAKGIGTNGSGKQTAHSNFAIGALDAAERYDSRHKDRS